MVSRKAHNLKTAVRFGPPQPRKENLNKFSAWQATQWTVTIKTSYTCFFACVGR